MTQEEFMKEMSENDAMNGIVNDDDQLTKIFAKVAENFNYNNCKAEFVAYKDFKVRWTRSYRWANFQVSDYLKGASEDVIEGLAKTLLSKISGCEDTPYNDAMKQFATSEEFVKRCQPIYLRRSRGLTKEAKGLHKDLNDSVNRLVDGGFIKKEEIRNFKFSWTTEELDKCGYCSALMETMAVSKWFDSEETPDFIIDMVVLYEIVTAKLGKETFGDGTFDCEQVKDVLKKHPMYEEFVNYLDRYRLQL